MKRKNYNWDSFETKANGNSDAHCMMYQCSEIAVQGAFGQRLCPTHHRLALKTAQEVLQAAKKFRPR